MSLFIEVLILLAILVEIAMSIQDGKKRDRQQEKIIELLEDSTAELADIRDETVAEEHEQSQSTSN
jgi:uncharacterized membrane protein